MCCSIDNFNKYLLFLKGGSLTYIVNEMLLILLSFVLRYDYIYEKKTVLLQIYIYINLPIYILFTIIYNILINVY